MERHSVMTRCAPFVLVGLLALETVGAQTNGTPVDAFLIKGVAADANGPISGRVLLVMPIDAKQVKPVVRQRGVTSTLGSEATRNPQTGKWKYTYKISVDNQYGPRLNPQTTTDAKGAFSVTVPRSLFKETPGCKYGCSEYKVGELGLGVFDGLVSSFETQTVKYDVNAPVVDVGRLVFSPAAEPTQ